MRRDQLAAKVARDVPIGVEGRIPDGARDHRGLRVGATDDDLHRIDHAAIFDHRQLLRRGIDQDEAARRRKRPHPIKIGHDAGVGQRRSAGLRLAPRRIAQRRVHRADRRDGGDKIGQRGSARHLLEDKARGGHARGEARFDIHHPRRRGMNCGHIAQPRDRH